MRTKSFCNVLFVLTIVLIAYGISDAQVVSNVKDSTVKATKKTVEVTKDIAGKTKDAVVDGTEKSIETGKAAGKTATKIGSYSVEVSENVAGTAYEGGKWLTVTTWDGTKWVSKRAWFATRKVADQTKKVLTSPDEK